MEEAQTRLRASQMRLKYLRKSLDGVQHYGMVVLSRGRDLQNVEHRVLSAIPDVLAADAVLQKAPAAGVLLKQILNLRP